MPEIASDFQPHSRKPGRLHYQLSSIFNSHDTGFSAAMDADTYQPKTLR